MLADHRGASGPARAPRAWHAQAAPVAVGDVGCARELPWVRSTGRRDELGLVAARRAELTVLLARVSALVGRRARGVDGARPSPTPDGWTALQDARRAEGVPALPPRLNRRTAAALAAPHTKATLTERRLAALGDLEATHDGSIRLRPPAGLVARTSRGEVDLAAVAGVLGEVSVPERALKDGFEFTGPLRAVSLVENLGAFCDLPPIDGWLFVHVAGWDTATVSRLFGCLGHVPVLHFGDLDPNGVRIFRHLRGLHPRLRWFVPWFWRSLSNRRACQVRGRMILGLTIRPHWCGSWPRAACGSSRRPS